METFLARQPIFDAGKNVYAYEILYRNSANNAFTDTDADAASADVIINAFQTFGIEKLTNNKPAFINFTENLINQAVATIIPKDAIVIEVLETVEASRSVIEKCRLLKAGGYTIALDDFVYQPQFESLIALADIIKIDFLLSAKAEIEQLVSRVSGLPVRLLAEKVETNVEFQYAKALGFSLFQGYFFSKPEVLKAKRLTPLHSSLLRLLAKANQENLDFDELAEMISRDLSLVYSLLRLINSAAFGLKKKVHSVKQALVLLGENEIRKWISLLALQNIGRDKPDELIRLSMIRARFIELIAIQAYCHAGSTASCRQLAAEFFFAGLFSLLDVMLDKPLAAVLEDIEAPVAVKDCLLNPQNEGQLYQLVVAYEKGHWDDVARYADTLAIACRSVTDSYISALLWYHEVTAA